MALEVDRRVLLSAYQQASTKHHEDIRFRPTDAPQIWCVPCLFGYITALIDPAVADFVL